MLPVYKAMAFDRIIDKGGRTRPWSVIVDTGSGAIPYVVKMFNELDVERRDPVTREVLGNVLAKEFDLPVPNAALVDFDPSFAFTIKDDEAIEVFDSMDDRPKFATAMIQGNYLYSTTFSKAQAKRMIGIDSLFAFDQLIRNADRTDGKPNLLVQGKSAFLIDHELAFDIRNDTLNSFITRTINDTVYQNHIFWKFLKRSHKVTKEEHFAEFEEYLKYLNINSLRPFLSQLQGFGYSNARHQLIYDYLDGVKRNLANFVSFLKMIT